MMIPNVMFMYTKGLVPLALFFYDVLVVSLCTVDIANNNIADDSKRRL